MSPIEMNEKFNEMFKQIQESVPYDTLNRDSAMCGKYSMYIGALEGIIKINIPKSRQAEVLKAIQSTVRLIASK